MSIRVIIQDQPDLGNRKDGLVSFWGALWELMLGNSGKVSNSYLGSGLLVFAAGSALMGFIAVLLDWIAFSIRGRSFFNLTYGKTTGNTVRLWCLWGVGAGVGGKYRSTDQGGLHWCGSWMAAHSSTPYRLAYSR